MGGAERGRVGIWPLENETGGGDLVGCRARHGESARLGSHVGRTNSFARRLNDGVAIPGRLAVAGP